MPDKARMTGEVTLKGQRLAWRHAPLLAEEPLSAWQGLLAARGLSEADPFFAPRLADLPDPFDMTDMQPAAERVVQALKAGEPIHVFGDFDADGVNGTAILVEALKAAGGQVSFSIPHRVDQGHGIGEEAVRQAVEAGCRLGISVDTGVSCFAACAEAKRLGLDLIVTDHHLPDAELPDAFALLNPARSDCGFADRLLCGSGVAFFLLMAVWKRLGEAGRRPEFDLRGLLDRVAVATVADVMELRGVNRILVHHGLEQLNSRPSSGMAALMRTARVRRAVTTETIGFYLAPMINAAGRMQHGEAAMRLLSTRDAGKAETLAAELAAANRERRQVESEVFKQAEASLHGNDVLAVFDPAWHAGVVGLAAGRLARKHGRPAAVGFVTPEGQIRLSLRGRPGFHIGKLLSACSDHLQGYGGHAGAGGATLERQDWDTFVQAFARETESQAESASDHLCCPIDGELGLGAMHIGLAERLERFQPFGRGNPACTWLLRDLHIADRRDMKGGVVRLKLTDGSRWIDGIVFGANGFSDAIGPGSQISVIGQLQRDEWRGNGAIQFVIDDLLASD